jgi:ABC-type sugar transport system substrate-binding protein
MRKVKPKFRILALLAVALAAAVTIAACGGDDDSTTSDTGDTGDTGTATDAATDSGKSASDLNIVYSLYDRQAAFFKGCVEGAEQAASDTGVNLQVELSGFDPAKQISQLENVILQQPDGIILTPIDAAAVEPALRQAVEAGIPIIGICDDFGSIEREAGPERISYIGPNYELTGRKKAGFPVAVLSQEGTDSGKIAAFFGVRGVPFDVATRAGEEAVFAENPSYEYIQGPYSREYSSDAGLKATQNVLAADPDIDGLICDNSDQCLGAVLAIEEAGRTGEILVSSNDGIPPELDALRDGTIDYTVAWCSFNEAELAVQQLIDLLVDGVPPPEYTEDVGRDLVAEGFDVQTDDIQSTVIGPDTEPTTQHCEDPKIEVVISEPKTELLDELGIEYTP